MFDIPWCDKYDLSVSVYSNSSLTFAAPTFIKRETLSPSIYASVYVLKSISQCAQDF